MATTISLDALDAIELAEILEFLVDCLDTLHLTALPACDHDVYNSNDLRADIARLIDRLHSCPAQSAPADDADPVTVEVDHGSASSRGQPPGRPWLIRLRCADRSVVVAVGLSQTAADHLAEHITDVISPTTLGP
jgi:hypothetical protein